MVRQIRSSRIEKKKRPQAPRDFADYLVQATESGTLDASRSVPEQTVKQVMAKKIWNQPSELEAIARQRTPISRQDTRAREEQPFQKAGKQRLGSTYFNEGISELTDLYQTPRLRASFHPQNHLSKRF